MSSTHRRRSKIKFSLLPSNRKQHPATNDCPTTEIYITQILLFFQNELRQKNTRDEVSYLSTVRELMVSASIEARSDSLLEPLILNVLGQAL